MSSQVNRVYMTLTAADFRRYQATKTNMSVRRRYLGGIMLTEHRESHAVARGYNIRVGLP